MSATTKIWANGVPPSCEDDDLNGFKNENNNLIVGSGQALSTADNQQTHKAVAHYSATGDFYVDSGAANVYVLSPTGSQVAPATYATGMRIRFDAGNANTGASTVNVDGLGVKALVQDKDGSALTAGLISAVGQTEAYYDGVSFRVVLTETRILNSLTASAAELNILDGALLSTTELNYVNGVSSDIQTQIDAKLPVADPTFTGSLSVGSASLNEAELEILDGAVVTTAELNNIDGGTSATATTCVDADRVVYNDAGTMKQVALTDLLAYFTGGLKTKIIEIGDWNMDTVDQVTAAHGLTYANIRSVSAVIRNDADGLRHQFASYARVIGASDTDDEYLYVNTVNVVLNRAQGGLFDDPNYDSTSYNRGWITIKYV
jgi:hypothetical protein